MATIECGIQVLERNRNTKMCYHTVRALYASFNKVVKEIDE